MTDRYAPRRIAPPPRHDAFRLARAIGWGVALLALAAVALAQSAPCGIGPTCGVVPLSPGAYTDCGLGGTTRVVRQDIQLPTSGQLGAAAAIQASVAAAMAAAAADPSLAEAATLKEAQGRAQLQALLGLTAADLDKALVSVGGINLNSIGKLRWGPCYADPISPGCRRPGNSWCERTETEDRVVNAWSEYDQLGCSPTSLPAGIHRPTPQESQDNGLVVGLSRQLQCAWLKACEPAVYVTMCGGGRPAPTPRPSPTPPVVTPTPPPPVVEPTPSPATCPAGTACRPEPAECAACPPALPACPPLSEFARRTLAEGAEHWIRPARVARLAAEIAGRRNCLEGP